MHIAFYSPGWPFESATSGIVTYVHWVRSELQRMGHRVSLITATQERDEADRIYGIDAGILRRIVRRLRLKLRIDQDLVFTVGSRIAEEAARIHRRDPIDVLEMEESFGWAAAVISLNRFPLVVKLHGPAFLTIPQDEADAHSEFVRRRIAAEGVGLSAARVITAPSQCTLESAITRYSLKPAIRTKVVNPLALTPGASLWSASASRRDRVLFVGRFDKAKGADRVLLGFRELLAHRPQIQLDFVGPDMGIRADNKRLCISRTTFGRCFQPLMPARSTSSEGSLKRPYRTCDATLPSPSSRRVGKHKGIQRWRRCCRAVRLSAPTPPV